MSSKKIFHSIGMFSLSLLCIACSSNHKGTIRVNKMISPLQFNILLMPGYEKMPFHVTNLVTTYYSGFDGKSCSGKLLNRDSIRDREKKSQDKSGFIVFKNHSRSSYDFRSLAENALANGKLNYKQLPMIKCVGTQFYGTVDGKNVASNVVEVPVVCGGQCSSKQCGCLAQGKTIIHQYHLSIQ